MNNVPLSASSKRPARELTYSVPAHLHRPNSTPSAPPSRTAEVQNVGRTRQRRELW
jgi:hypothetical protein